MESKVLVEIIRGEKLYLCFVSACASALDSIDSIKFAPAIRSE